MFSNFQSIGYEIFYPFFPIVIIVISLLALVLFWVNRKVFIKPFKNVSNISLLILFLIIISFVLICVSNGLNFKFFNASDCEWMEFNVARNLLLGDESAFNQLPDRIVSPVILAFGFRIFGFNPLVASLLNLFLAVLSIFLIFLLSQIIFDNEKISLFSSFIYAFAPLTLVYTSLRMGDPTTVGFFLLLFVITAILSFRHHKFSLHILTLVFFTLASQTKLEYFILIFPYIICFIVFKEYKHFSYKKVIILIILFFIFSSPFFVSNIHFRKSCVSGWCGYPSQTFHSGKIYSYTLPLTGVLDKVIKTLGNERFSINYLIYDIPNFVKFWFSQRFIFVSSLIFSGMLFSFKRYKKETLFIFLSFLFISVVYLADCIFYEERLAVPTYGLIIVFAGFALSLFLTKILPKMKIKKLIEIFIIILAILIALFLWYFNSRDVNKFDSYKTYSSCNIFNDYNHLQYIVDYYGLSPINSYVIVPHHSERQMLQFLGYETDCLTDLVVSDYFQDRQKFLDSFVLPMSKTKNNYFIYTWNCETLAETSDICNFVKDNYTKKQIGQMDEYEIYLLKEKGQ